MRNTIITLATLIGAGAWYGYANSDEGTNGHTGETAGTVTTVSEETPAEEEPGDPLSEYAFLLMEHLRSLGYPVYDKNIIFCSGVTVPLGREFIILGTDDEREEVIGFYVAAGGTPEYDNGAVVFRDWGMPITVSASREGGTGVIYDVLGDVFSDETE